MEPLGGEACEGNFTSASSHALSSLKWINTTVLKAKQVEAIRVVYERRYNVCLCLVTDGIRKVYMLPSTTLRI